MRRGNTPPPLLLLHDARQHTALVNIQEEYGGRAHLITLHVKSGGTAPEDERTAPIRSGGVTARIQRRSLEEVTGIVDVESSRDPARSICSHGARYIFLRPCGQVGSSEAEREIPMRGIRPERPSAFSPSEG